MDDNEDLEQVITKINSYNSLFDEYQKTGFQQKNSLLSTRFRNEGNTLYRQKSHDEKTHQMILQLYTKSIAYAVEGSEEQAIAYSNRSALLMHLKKYQECLIDVNIAFKITQSQDLKKKLLLRQEKCKTLINNEDVQDWIRSRECVCGAKDENSSSSKRCTCSPCPQDIAVYASYMTGKVSDNDEVLRKKMNLPKTVSYDEMQETFKKLKVPKILSPNKMIPSFSEKLILNYSEEYGRHVIASRDIRPGEILVIEKGLVFPAGINKIYLACSNCLNFTWNGVPCHHCVFAVYCSKKCKLKAWQEYHDIECSILPPLFSKAFPSQNMSHEMSCLRLFIKVFQTEGLQNLIDQAKSIDNSKSYYQLTLVILNL